jgi:hypothetical protein
LNAAARRAGDEGILVKIAGMVVWVLTAGIGIYLLAAGMAAQRQAAGGARPAAGDSTRQAAGHSTQHTADDSALQAAGDSTRQTAGHSTRQAAEGGTGLASAGGGPDPLAPGPDGATVVGAAALARLTAPGDGAAADGGGPGVEGSPLLEFIHPLLALLGLTFWIFFVMTSDRLFAWIAFGVVVATVLAGLSWALLTRRVARRADREPAVFPGHLVMIHGLAAACTLALVVISAIIATRT